MINLKSVIKDSDLEKAYSCKATAPLSEIKTEKDHKFYLNELESWISLKKELTSVNAKKIVSESIKHTANLLEKYESNKYNSGKLKPNEILQSFMDEFDLKQRDLAIHFGSQSIVSEVLRQKRSISIEAAKKLGKHFSVSPLLFLEL